MYAAIVVTKGVAVFSLSHPPTLYNSTVVPNFLCPLHPFHHESEYRPLTMIVRLKRYTLNKYVGPPYCRTVGPKCTLAESHAAPGESRYADGTDR